MYRTTLYEITGTAARIAQAIQEALDNPDLSDKERDAALAAALEEREDAQELFNDKLDNCRKFIRSLEAEEEAIRAEEAALTNRRRARERAEETFRAYVIRELKKVDGKLKLPTGTMFIKRAKHVEVTDEQALPTDRRFWRFKEPELNKTEFKKALEAGEDVQGGRLVETESLVIR